VKGRSSPYTLTSSLAVLLLDWAVYAITMVTYADALWPAITLGSAIALACVTLFEYRGDDSLTRALTKGSAAAAAVAVPLPLLGSALAAVCFAWGLKGRQMHSR